jgi:hypothetical protein
VRRSKCVLRRGVSFANCVQSLHLWPEARVSIKDSYKTDRAIGQLEAAQDLHQIVNLASGGGATRFKVLLHTQACEERQECLIIGRKTTAFCPRDANGHTDISLVCFDI